MAAGRQLRLLLWKDYVIRRRKLITVAGISWAIAVVLSLYIVRVNIDNENIPTCQFAARALPSAGVLTFMQSFLCSVNNECTAMDKFEELPTYENSKLTQLQRQFAPLLYNETVLNVAATVPDGLKLLATLSDIVDQPTFVDISKNGLKVKDLFTNPKQVKRYLGINLELPNDVAEHIMSADVKFQGLLKGGIDRCNPKSISDIISMTKKDVEILAEKLCSLSNSKLEEIAVKLVMGVNFEKYLTMIGDMYYKLTGDRRFTQIGGMVTAVLRMVNIESLLPKELANTFMDSDNGFHYFNMTIISKLLDLYEPTFGDTETYQTLRDITNAAVTGMQYINRIVSKPTDGVIDDLRTNANKVDAMNIKSPKDLFKNAIAVFEESNGNDTGIGVVNVIAQITKVVYKFLPDTMKKDISYYSTLLAKLMEGALKVIDINMHIKEMAYNVSLRNPDGVKVLMSLPTHIIAKGFEALADAERTQIFTSKLNFPGKMFCDTDKLARFFVISITEASTLKNQLCTDAWKGYAADLIKSFGIFEVRDNINNMASLVIQNTIGRDISDQLYSLDKIFDVLKNFTAGLTIIRNYEEPDIYSQKLFNLTKDSAFKKILNEKGHLGKQMLITVHGALAKEVVTQNVLLNYKISPTLVSITIVVEAVNDQLRFMMPDLVTRLKSLYPDIIQIMLATTLNEEKTYKSLSTPDKDIVCNGTDNAALYLVIPENIDLNNVTTALCDTANVIENGMKGDSVLAKAIAEVQNSSVLLDPVDWTTLINNVKSLYMTLNADYPYLFDYKTFGMDVETQAKVSQMLEKSKQFWFNWNHLERSLHLSAKLLFRLLDVMDRGLFNIRTDTWLKIKQALRSTSGPTVIVNDFVMELTALLNNEPYSSKLPKKTSLALAAIVPNAPQLIVDFANVIVNDSTEIEPIIVLMNSEPAWPCSSISISEYITLNDSSKTAVKGLETLMCMDNELQQQWKKYLDMNDVSENEPHTFLKFSAAFNLMINDIIVLNDTLTNIFKNNVDDGSLSFVNAWKRAVKIVNNTDTNLIFGNFFSKLDAVLTSINTTVSSDLSTSLMWEEYIKCANGTIIAGECKKLGRAAWRYSLETLSVMFYNIADDLMVYFSEINEPNSNILQILGFTRRTGLYIIYDKLPEFVGALINSYFDYGFMSQIRRASLSEFWDCEAVLDAIQPLPGGGIDAATIHKIKPFVCPSILYWISLPRGDNTLLDIFAKPLYFFYALPVQNLTSDYKNAFTKATELANLLRDIAKKNDTRITEDDLKTNSIEEKLKRTVDTILNYKIDVNDAYYKLYNEINTKQFYSIVYLTRVVASVNKLSNSLNNLKVEDITNTTVDTNKLESELRTLQNLFKRRPSDTLALFFDLITDILWTNSDNYTLTSAIKVMCDNLSNDINTKDILNEGYRVKRQICDKDYNLIYGAVQNVLNEDIESTRNGLVNLIRVLESDNIDKIDDIASFLNERKQLMRSLKKSVKYAYDLKIPIYLKYLQTNLENYNIALAFLTGGDWWAELRDLYGGPHVTNFLNVAENSLEIAEDILTNLDRIHLVRLLRDIDLNSTSVFCRPNVSLSDYFPDSTGSLAVIKRQVCEIDKREIFKEIPPLVYASQGYDSELKLTEDVDYTNLNAVISKTESKLEQVKDGPRSPERPRWVTEDKLAKLRTVATQLMSKKSLTKIAFGLAGNVVDACTLFLNSSNCVRCSEMTTWFKQINLQLFKKQEYDSLLCHLHTMNLEEVHYTLKNDFHWDMAIKEIISSRNYTKNEMNKSIGELLEQIKLHLLEDLTNKTKLEECLATNISRNPLGNATLFLRVLTHTFRLIRAELPHIQEIDGMKDVPYLKKLSAAVAHRLDVWAPLEKYLVKENLGQIDSNLLNNIREADVNLRVVTVWSNNKLPPDISKIVKGNNLEKITDKYNTESIFEILNKHINKTLIDEDLQKLQTKKFWKFDFVTNILYHTEVMIEHIARLLGVASKIDVSGAAQGRLAALIDMGMEIINDDVLTAIVLSIQGIAKELQPLLHEMQLEKDLTTVADGLIVLLDLKKSLLENDLKVETSSLFRAAERVEAALSRLGVNNTNFWSIAAPRIHAGHFEFKPLFIKQDEYHISRFVCQHEWLSIVVVAANLDVVTVEDVSAAVVEQFCGIGDEQAKLVLGALVDNLNYSFIIEKVVNTLLSKLYIASNLSESQGRAVLDSLPQMAELLPTIQGNVGELSEVLADEPLFQSLKNFTNVGNLLSSSNFMSSAGNMLCGKPFYLDMSRVFQNVLKAKDMSDAPSEAQLEVLPTDFCRTLYKDIINIEGGKIVWKFVKPLIMGKILYTPDTPLVRRIIEKANDTFSHMTKLTDLIHSFARAFSSVDKLAEHRDGVTVLRKVISSPVFEEFKTTLIGEQEIPDVDIDGVFDEFGDLKGVGGLLSKVSDLLQCVNLNRFRAMPDEDELANSAAKLSLVDEFSAGLVFLNTENQPRAPKNIEYMIRMDLDNVPSTHRLKNYMWVPGPEANFFENMRYFRGFVQIQDMVDRAIIEVSKSDIQKRQKRETRTEDNWAVYTQQMPYPCYRRDIFQTGLYESQALLVAFFFSLLYTVASAVRFIIEDKESGNTMLMSVMGVDLKYHTLSWFLTSFVEMIITCTCVAMVLCYGNILPMSTPSLIFTLLFIFGFSVLCFCYMLSKMFSSASFAAVCAAIAYLVTFMPIIITLSLEDVMSSSYKIFICFSMSSSLCYSFLYVARYEAMGAGASWADIWSSPIEEGSDMSIAIGAIMMVADGIIYLIIGWLIDRFFGIKTLRSNITNCVTTSEKAGVSIVNITKIYNEGSRRAKLALDNVSIELHKGQITTLLGHNGAGKTTLTNILTGMMKPTKGHVIIRSQHNTATRLGVCPQKDVLFEYMSAKEHVALYAQLKSGLPLEQVKDEVDRLVLVLSLGALGGLPACRLSGGTRRRLCVALAFAGGPPLVALDEPTAGVDPKARRDIWAMIARLKEDRTILMTTHHLDEAELLSDQIVIMHKGQIHTTGSPVEIKRTLGTGYKLTVMYPKRDQDSWLDDEDVSSQERTKQLLGVVRDVVKNASLVDVSDDEVEITLPFYDANGLNNNFLQLCTVLENGQDTLCFKDYSVECSSLEQVFFNICRAADAEDALEYQMNPGGSTSSPSKSASTASVRPESAPLVGFGPLRARARGQLLALAKARLLHLKRNRWLLFLLVGLPALFITLSMCFATIRPPANNERPLPLNSHLYINTTQFLVSNPSIVNSTSDPTFAENVMRTLKEGGARNWTQWDNPSCACTDTKQMCNISENAMPRPDMMLLPGVNELNKWLLSSQDVYIEKRYGGFSSSIKNNVTHLIAWYNNKGHHSLPSFVNALNVAALRAATGLDANITTYSYPLKISEEQINKNTVYQHIADAGISALVMLSYSLLTAASSIYLVFARVSQQKRLQLLCGVSPMVYWTVALLWDMTIIIINIVITVVVMEIFQIPVYVERENLPAICLLIFLYGYASSCMVHVLEKLFTEPSMANMLLFCGGSFFGLSAIALLLILDIISLSDATDNARNILHKVFMLSPQFALGDGMLEIAKNTIQAQVLGHFGMDTYRHPFSSDLIAYHCLALLLVGTALLLLNLAIEYDLFDGIIVRFSPKQNAVTESDEEFIGVADERKRVSSNLAHAAVRLRLNTIGNINAGYVESEDGAKKKAAKYLGAPDVAQCVALGKSFGERRALQGLTLGIPRGQCTALLGQNGAGKSTTFAMLTGQIRPSAGRIYLDERPVDARGLCQGHISYCPQSDAIDPLMTVTETLTLYCQLRGIDDKDEVIRRALDMFELSKFADTLGGALSGGNKRKLCTAVALMGRSALVLLDEPTSGADPVASLCVQRAVRSACAAGRGVLLSSHALPEARRLAQRVALLRDSRLVALSDLADCLQRFGGGYVVQCVTGRAGPRDVWRRVRARKAHARLHVLHVAAIHFLLPTHATVNGKEVWTRLSDIFRLMSELQSTCDIEDYTINQSSLDQMFLSFTDKADMDFDADLELEPVPSPETLKKNIEGPHELNNVKSESPPSSEPSPQSLRNVKNSPQPLRSVRNSPEVQRHGEELNSVTSL